jgi:hypothetical protein
MVSGRPLLADARDLSVKTEVRTKVSDAEKIVQMPTK